MNLEVSIEFQAFGAQFCPGQSPRHRKVNIVLKPATLAPIVRTCSFWNFITLPNPQMLRKITGGNVDRKVQRQRQRNSCICYALGFAFLNVPGRWLILKKRILPHSSAEPEENGSSRQLYYNKAMPFIYSRFFGLPALFRQSHWSEALSLCGCSQAFPSDGTRGGTQKLRFGGSNLYDSHGKPRLRHLPARGLTAEGWKKYSSYPRRETWSFPRHSQWQQRHLWVHRFKAPFLRLDNANPAHTRGFPCFLPSGHQGCLYFLFFSIFFITCSFTSKLLKAQQQINEFNDPWYGKSWRD